MGKSKQERRGRNAVCVEVPSRANTTFPLPPVAFSFPCSPRFLPAATFLLNILRSVSASRTLFTQVYDTWQPLLIFIPPVPTCNTFPVPDSFEFLQTWKLLSLTITPTRKETSSMMAVSAFQSRLPLTIIIVGYRSCDTSVKRLFNLKVSKKLQF